MLANNANLLQLISCISILHFAAANPEVDMGNQWGGGGGGGGGGGLWVASITMACCAYSWSQPWGDLWVASIEPSVGMAMYQPYWLLWVGNGRIVHRGGVSLFTMCLAR